jgi:hypothetical protein
VAQRGQARQLGIIWRRFGWALRCRSRRCEEAARVADGVLSRLNARDLVLMERNWLNSPQASMDNPLGRIHPLDAAAACLWSQLSNRVTARRASKATCVGGPRLNSPQRYNRSAFCGAADQFRPLAIFSQLDPKPTSRFHSELMFASRMARPYSSYFVRR